MTQQGFGVRLMSVGLLGIAAFVMNACHTGRPAPVDRGQVAPLPTQDAWPARDLSAVRGFHERTPDVIFPWEPNGLVPVAELAEAEAAALSMPERRVIVNRLTPQGLLRVWERRERRGEETSMFAGLFGLGRGFTPNASFLSSRDASGVRLQQALEDVPAVLGAPRNERNFMRPGLQQSFTDDAVLLDDGIDLRVPTKPGSRGTMLVMGGLFSTKWQERVVDRMAELGWAIVQIDPAITVRGPNDDALRLAYAQERERSQARLIARMEAEDAERAAAEAEGAEPSTAVSRLRDTVRNSRRSSDLMLAEMRADQLAHPRPPTGFELLPETDEVELGRLIARSVDDTIAENAYAASAALELMARTHGREALGPVVVMGFSAGSLPAPAVAARLRVEGFPLDAMILIGAGANLFEIAVESTVSDGGIRLGGHRLLGDPKPEFPQQRLDEVNAAYLATTRLDPYVLAPALRDVPTLLVLATDDKAVPNADVLDERLGFPERITYHGGHGGLFYFLPGKTSSMVRWLDRVAPRE